MVGALAAAALGLLLGLLAVLVVLSALWVWARSDGSLLTALRWSERWGVLQIAGSAPRFSEVQGSLLGGGRIGRLQWSSDAHGTLIVSSLQWQPDASLLQSLHDRRLTGLRVQVDQVQWTPTAKALAADTPNRPPWPSWLDAAALRLPWFREIDVTLQVGLARWDEDPRGHVGPVDLRYRYRPLDEPVAMQHAIGLTRLQWQESEWTGDLTVGTQGALPLDLRLKARGNPARLGGPEKADLGSWTADLALQGDLQGPQPRLRLQLDVAPDERWTDVPSDVQIDTQARIRSGTRLRLRTEVQPAAAWPLGELDLSVQDLDLQQWWPQAPHTRIRGEARVAADADADATPPALPSRWRVMLDFRDTLAQGHPIRQNRLQPLESLAAQGVIQSDSRGSLDWTLQRLTARLAGESMTASARGRWHAARWVLDRWNLQFLGAQMQGQDLRMQGRILQAGTAHWTLPGASLKADVASNRRVEALLQVHDATAAQTWIVRQIDHWALLWPPIQQSAMAWRTWLEPRVTGGLEARLQWQPRRPASAVTWWAWEALAVDVQAKRLSRAAEPLKPQSAAAAHGRLSLRADTRSVVLNFPALELRHGSLPFDLDLQLPEPLRVVLREDDSWDAPPGRLELGFRRPGARAQSMTLLWERMSLRDGLLAAQGRTSGLELQRWQDAFWPRKTGQTGATGQTGPLTKAGLKGDLEVTARWNLAWPWGAGASLPPPGSRARIDLSLQRLRGDLEHVADSGAPLKLGLEDLEASVGWVPSQALRVNARIATAQLGSAQGQLSLEPRGTPGDWADLEWGNAVLQGDWRLDLPHLRVLAAWLPTGWRVDGRVGSQGRIGGTVEQPLLSGTLQAQGLALRSVLDGVDFHSGSLEASFENDRMQVQRLSLSGSGTDGGELTGSGQAQWRPNGQGRLEPELDLHLTLKQLRLLARNDLRVRVSGNLQSHWTAQGMVVKGSTLIDQAQIEWRDEGTVALGPDVVIKGQAAAPVPTVRDGLPLELDLKLDLGPSFEVRALGAQALLEGRLDLQSKSGLSDLRVVGDIRSRRGEFRAYGQRLNLQRGLLRFSGSPENPVLDVLALRPNSTPTVGVTVTGSARAPVMRLYSEPELPDTEKLAWLLFGRPLTGSGAQAALMQQAALALLSGRGDGGQQALKRLGLDDISVQVPQGTAGGPPAGSAQISVGKRLNDQLYLTYARGLVGTIGTVAVFFDISRRLSLRAQAGDVNAVDLVFTRRSP